MPFIIVYLLSNIFPENLHFIARYSGHDSYDVADQVAI